MNFQVKSYRCPKCGREEFVYELKKKHWNVGKLCKSEIIEEWTWNRGNFQIDLIKKDKDKE